MKNLNHTHFAQAIGFARNEFSTHELQRLMQLLYPVELAQEIHSYGATPEGLREFSRQFSLFVQNNFSSSPPTPARPLTQVGTTTDLNLRGESSVNALWRK